MPLHDSILHPLALHLQVADVAQALSTLRAGLCWLPSQIKHRAENHRHALCRLPIAVDSYLAGELASRAIQINFRVGPDCGVHFSHAFRGR